MYDMENSLRGQKVLLPNQAIGNKYTRTWANQSSTYHFVTCRWKRKQNEDQYKYDRHPNSFWISTNEVALSENTRKT